MEFNEVKQFHVKPTRLLVGWSQADLAWLWSLRMEQGRPTVEIAALMHRSHSAVRIKLTRLGWTEPHKRRA